MAKYTHINKGNFAETDKKNVYSRFNVDAMFTAMKDIGTMGGFKLWCYLSVRLNDREEWDLSPKECGNSVGLKDDALRDAKRLLVKKGYLEDLGEDTYIFHQISTEMTAKEKDDTESMIKKMVGATKIEWEF